MEEMDLYQLFLETETVKEEREIAVIIEQI
jgi:hypothetical protein